MADGYNQIRAMRVQEIMQDFRTLQTWIASIRANPSAEEYNEDGFIVLRKCVGEAQALLTQPFQSVNTTNGDEEAVKAQLRRIIIDASLRRFRMQKIYLQAAAALRWVNSRAAVLQGQNPHAGHTPALQQIRNAFRQELASITDQRVEMCLRTADSTQGKWLVEDPPLATLQRLVNNCSGNGIGR